MCMTSMGGSHGGSMQTKNARPARESYVEAGGNCRMAQTSRTSFGVPLSVPKKCCAAPSQAILPDQGAPDQSAKIAHRSNYQTDSRASVRWFGFAVGTGEASSE